MKNTIKLVLLVTCSMFIAPVYGQESANASGGEATGSGGTVAYSIGQTAYSYQNGSNGNMSQGIQQAYEIYSIGIDELEVEIKLNAFPNPTSDLLTIQFEEFGTHKATFQLVDQEGEVLQESQIINIISSLDLSTYAQGAYFLRIATESTILKTFKIIKK